MSPIELTDEHEDADRIRCVDCGSTNKQIIRDDWEFTEPAMLCCHCNSERLNGCRMPQEYYIDGD